MVLLFDAANTLIHKPSFYDAFVKTLNDFNISINVDDFKRNHKLVSELYHFPDRTDANFYNSFNKELLFSMGIIPNDELLNKIFQACSYLPWEKFDDISVLKEIPHKKAVLSNFHKDLKPIMNTHFSEIFDNIIISETIGLRKPDVAFYEKAIEILNVKPSEIIYIGDSIKLDIVPAQEAGIDAHLIDRNNYYPEFKKRLQSLTEIKNII